MKIRTAFPRTTLWLTAAIGLTASSSCSLIYDFSISQCDQDQDCERRGGQFRGSACLNHVCVQKAGVGGASTGGQSAGGVAAGGDSSTQGGAGTGGSAPSATGGAFSCTSGDTECCITHKDCIDTHVDDTYLCKDHKCLLLTDNVHCPIMIPPVSATAALNYKAILSNPAYAPIIVGGFANMTNPQSLYETKSVINWTMAINEFNTAQTQTGLPGKGGVRRPVIGLMCYSNVATSDALNAAMKRLTEDVGVAGILSTLAPADLLSAYYYTNKDDTTIGNNPAYTGNPVFFMNTSAADSSFASIDTHNLVWSIMGDPNVIAADVTALLKQMEPYVKKQLAASGYTGDLKVTMVTSTYPTATDLGNTLISSNAKHPEAHLFFNGKFAYDQGVATTGNFRTISEPTSIGLPAGITTVDTAAITAVLNEVHNNPPHVIVVMATNEFAKQVIGSIEASWSGSWGLTQNRPYYILSPFLVGSSDLTTQIVSHATKTPPLHMRLAGVNSADAQDAHSKSLYNSYRTRLTTFYTGGLAPQLPSTENHYDGAYYLLYSIAQAIANKTESPGNLLHGNDIYNALFYRIISDSASAGEVDVDPTAIDAVLNSFAANPSYQISLWGTMGTHLFDKPSGLGTPPSSAWCIHLQTNSTTAYEYKMDGLVYDPFNKNFTPNTVGIPLCLQNYCPLTDAGTGPCPLTY